jgi:hypothetical protein
MISINTHHQLQGIQKLPFCYTCGALFTQTNETEIMTSMESTRTLRTSAEPAIDPVVVSKEG